MKAKPRPLQLTLDTQQKQMSETKRNSEIKTTNSSSCKLAYAPITKQ